MQRADFRGTEGSGRRASPPKRDDDREGHYVYSLGENLTPRCELFRNLSLSWLFFRHRYPYLSRNLLVVILQWNSFVHDTLWHGIVTYLYLLEVRVLYVAIERLSEFGYNLGI